MFPNILIELKNRKCTQRELAKFVGISYSSMNGKMNGRADFTLSEMRRIQEALGSCSLDYLFLQYNPK